MPQYLTIPDDWYSEAVNGIADVRAINDPEVNRIWIEQQLRSYVYLGQHKKISDWIYPLTDDEKDAIINPVRSRMQNQYSVKPDYAWLSTNFNVMEALAGRGQVAPNIARPRSAQESSESNIANANANDPTFLDNLFKGIKDFFGVAKSAIESALKGLGINIPIEAIIGLAVVVALYFFSRNIHTA